MTKSAYRGDMVDGSSLKAMVAGDRGLEWTSTVKVLTIGLFTVGCFYRRQQLATNVDIGEFGSFSIPCYKSWKEYNNS
ncbi:hypothetical protein PVK06_023421 [Gossypium arboreum]|uniref:Uncharacterized protein n=1 Tax=Gossypium arboreum TaxID=29729 RepID=A0ABR0PB95_GOSAR|nr:hypothetical protein PVK06_023421 [Gossypium arboreum]